MRPKGNRNLTPEEKAEIAALYKAGEKLLYIGSVYKIHESFVRVVVREMGEPPRPLGYHRRPPAERHP